MYSPQMMRILVGSEEKKASKHEATKTVSVEKRENFFVRFAKLATVPIQIRK